LSQIQYTTKLSEAKILFVFKANTMSKLLLISNLLLGEKTVRPAEGGAPNSFAKSGQTQWAALCAAHESVGSKPLSSILVSLLYHARTFFQNR
jgi:hypothetical protein